MHILPLNCLLLLSFIRVTDMSAFCFCSDVSESGLIPLRTFISSICLYYLNMMATTLSMNILYPISNGICFFAPGDSRADSVCNTCVKMALTEMLFRLLVVFIVFTISTPNSWVPYCFLSKDGSYGEGGLILCKDLCKLGFYHFHTFIIFL